MVKLCLTRYTYLDQAEPAGTSDGVSEYTIYGIARARVSTEAQEVYRLLRTPAHASDAGDALTRGWLPSGFLFLQTHK